MRPRSLLLLLLVASIPLLAQDEETLLSGEVESGGFGGPVLKIGPVNGKTGVFVGGRGGWIINHSFIIGGGGYGLVNDVAALVPSSSGETLIGFGYGGLELEYIPVPYRLVNASFMLLIGGGGLMYRVEGSDVNFDSHGGDAVFVLEPQVSVTLNVIRWLRISASMSYRFVTGVDIAASSDRKLSGPSGGLTVRFGKF